MTRPRLQFRLRTLFVITTIVAIQCAVCLPMWREWKQQQDKRDRDFDELIKLITISIAPSSCTLSNDGS